MYTCRETLHERNHSRSSLQYEERASRHRPRGNGHGSLSRKGKGQADAYHAGALQRRAQNQGPAAVWPLERPRGYKRSGFLCSPLAPPPLAKVEMMFDTDVLIWASRG